MTSAGDQVAGASFAFPALASFDTWGNPANGSRGEATVYAGAKTINWAMTGMTNVANGPDGTLDTYTLSVTFASGVANVGVTPLTTTLYREQDGVAITANAADDGGVRPNIACAAFNVKNGAPDHYTVTTSTTTPVTSQLVNITITVKDFWGNIVTGHSGAAASYTGTVLLFSDATAPQWYSPIYGFAASDAGVKTLNNAIAFNTVEPGKTIYARDSSNSAIYGQSALIGVTPATDMTPPVITNIQVTPGTTSVTVHWTTDELASSQVEYGTTSVYGTSTTESDTSPRVTSHSVVVSSLIPDTAYHFRVKSTDGSSHPNQAISDDGTFRTQSLFSVAITSPAAGATVSGSVTILATNGDNYQIDGGGWNGIGSHWDTTAVPNGSHTIRAKGTISGQTAYSDQITVVVNNGNVPTFIWTTPATGSTLAYTTSVTATYTVGNFDTTTVKYSVNGGLWTAAGDATQAGIAVQVGTNTLQLKADKTVGGVTTTGYSSINTFVVNAQLAPTVVITGPAAGAAVSGAAVSITATTNSGAPTASAFYQIDGGAWVAYGMLWDTTVIANGSHTIRAKDTVATVTGYSDQIAVVVNNGNVPAFSWTAPITGSTLAYTTSVTATYTVTNFDAGVSAVQYSVNGGAWATAGDALQTLIPVQVGTNTIQLRATKTVNSVATMGYSSVNTFVVSAPIVIITAPAASDTVSGAAVAITATTNGGAPTGAAAYQIDGGAWVAYGTPWSTIGLTNDAHSIRVKDTVGTVVFTSTFVSVTVSNPVVVLITAPTAGQTVSGATVSVQFTTNGGAPTAAQVSIDGAAFSPTGVTNGVNPGTYTLDTTGLTNGSHTVQVRDTVNLITANSLVRTFIVNNAAPINTNIQVLAISQTGATVTWTTDKLGSSIVDYGTTSTYVTSTPETDTGAGTTSHTVILSGLLPDTTYHFRVKSTDAVPTARQGVSGDNTFTTLAYPTPTVVITAPLSGATVSTATQVVNFTTNGVSSSHLTAQVSIDGGAWAPATADGTYTWNTIGLTNDSHTIRVKDTVNNVVGYSSIVNVTVNNPVLVIITAPAAGATVSGTTVAITFTSNGVASSHITALVSVDGGAWNAVTVDGTYSLDTTGLTNGSHTVQVRDTVNLITANSLVRTFIVDNAAPVITNIRVSGVTYTGATVTWTTDKASDSQVEYGLTSSYGSSTVVAPAMVTSHSVTLTLSAGTTYHFRVKSTDAAAHMGISGDNTLTATAYPIPTVAITSPTAGAKVGGSVTINFQTNGAATTAAQISIDGAPFTTVGVVNGATGSFVWNTLGLTNSAHTIQVMDTVNGVAGYSQTLSVTVDNSVNVAITAPAAGTTVSGTTVAITATTNSVAPTSAKYSIDGSTTWVDYGTAWNTVGLTNGVHAIQVKDTISGVTGYSPVVTVTVNNPVVVLITTPAAGATVSGSAVAITATTNTGAPTASAQYQIDGGAWVAYGTAWNTLGLANSSHTIQVQDTVGGITAASIVRTVIVDNAPAVISNIQVYPITQTDATVTWTTDKAANSQIYYGTTPAYGSSTVLDPTLVTSHSVALSPLTAGTTYYFKVNSSTAVYLTESSGHSFTTLSNPTPAVAITLPAASATVTGSYNVNFTTNGGLTTAAMVSIDGATYVAATTNANPGTYTWSTVGLTNGAHTIQVKDTVSGITGYSSLISVTVNNPVVVLITAPAAGATVSGSAVSVTFTTNGGATAAAQISIDGAAFTATGVTNANPGTFTWNTSGLTNGSHTIQVQDTVSGITAASIVRTVVVDNASPAITNIQVSGSSYTGATITWTTNNLADSQVEYGATTSYGTSTAVDPTMTLSHSVTLSGLSSTAIYHFRVKSVDAFGHLGVSNDDTFSRTGMAMSVQTLTPYATSDNTYTNGWKIKMDITVNNSAETNLKMLFNNWMSGSNSIAANGNMKIALTDDVAGVQAGTVGVAVGNNYTDQTTALSLVGANHDSSRLYTTIYIYVKVPSGTAGGSYSTNYNVQTTP